MEEAPFSGAAGLSTDDPCFHYLFNKAVLLHRKPPRIMQVQTMIQSVSMPNLARQRLSAARQLDAEFEIHRRRKQRRVETEQAAMKQRMEQQTQQISRVQQQVSESMRKGEEQEKLLVHTQDLLLKQQQQRLEQAQQQVAALQQQVANLKTSAGESGSRDLKQKDKGSAAIKIQAVHRGKRSRAATIKQKKEKDAATVKIQAVHRGTRSRAATIKEKKEKDAAAVKIQAVQRGKRSRKSRADRLKQGDAESEEGDQQENEPESETPAVEEEHIALAAEKESNSGADEEAAAATRIQARIRGKNARKTAKKKASPAASSSAGEKQTPLLDRLTAFYGKYQPDKLENPEKLAKTAAKYAADEATLNAALRKKYDDDLSTFGVASSAGDGADEEAAAATRIQARIRGKNARKTAKKKASPAASSSAGEKQTPLLDRLTAFYGKYQPDKLENPEKLAKTAAKYAADEATLNAALRKKYDDDLSTFGVASSSAGDGADEEAAAATRIQARIRGKNARKTAKKKASPAASSSAGEKQTPLLDRLTAFYGKYQPDKLENPEKLAKTAAKYAADEATLNAALRKKYDDDLSTFGVASSSAGDGADEEAAAATRIQARIRGKNARKTAKKKASPAASSSAGEKQTPLLDRLTAFYGKYQPDKLENPEKLAKTAAKYAADEATLNAALRKKYDDDLSTFGVASSSAGDGADEEAAAATRIQARIRGKNARKTAKKKASPAASSSAGEKQTPLLDRLTAFYGKYQPDKLENPEKLAKTAAKYAADEATLNAALRKKYDDDLSTFGVASSSAGEKQTPLLDRLTAFYAKYQPDKLENPEKLAKTAAKYAADEATLNAALRKKYDDDLSTFGVASSSAGEKQMPLLDRLTAFYGKYQPDKLENPEKLAKTAAKYAADEATLNAALRKKYDDDLSTLQ